MFKIGKLNMYRINRKFVVTGKFQEKVSLNLEQLL